MIKLEQQGFRISNPSEEPIEIKTSEKGNSYQNFTVVPYLTKEEEETAWIRVVVFGDNCVEGLQHKDLLLLSGDMEFSYYMSQKQQDALAQIGEDTAQALRFKGSAQFNMIAREIKVSDREEIREVMGFKKPEETASANLETGGADDSDEIPF